jgi:TonB-dependent receptor
MAQSTTSARLLAGASLGVIMLAAASAASAQTAPAQPSPAPQQAVPLPGGSQPGATTGTSSVGTSGPPETSPEGVPLSPSPAEKDITSETAGDPNEVEAVVVTGFRASLNNAINLKRRETAVVDVIKAEDIADFPDANLAESIQRVPGVSISRDAGEGRQITVRGLSPQFTRVRINGMEGQSTASGTDSSGGNNRSRAFDFSVFASELFNSITVRKTPSAEVEEGSLGATVDLQTSRPFDYRGFQLALSAQQGYNDLAESWDPRLAGLISNTWMDGRFGALLSVAYSKRNGVEEGFGSVGWDTAFPTNGGFCAPASPTLTTPCAPGSPRTSNPAAFAELNRSDRWTPRIPRYGRFNLDQERLGVTTSLQWKPTDRFQANLDILHSTFQANREEIWLEAFSFSRAASANGKPQTSVLEVVIAPDGDLAYGLFNGVDIRSETRIDEVTSTYDQVTLSGEWEATDRLTLRGHIGRSVSELDNPITTTITIDRPQTNGYAIDFRGDDKLPNITYGFDVNNPANYVFGPAGGLFVGSEIRLRPQQVVNEFNSVAFDADYQVSDALTIKAGYAAKDFQFSSDARTRASEISVPALPPGITVANLVKTVSGFGKNLDIPSGVPTTWVTPDIKRFEEVFNIYSNTGTFALAGVPNATARGNIFEIGEKTQALYLQGDFELGIFPVPVRGDVGVRYVETEQTSFGYQLLGSTPTGVTVTREYEDVLPALNLVAEVTPDFLVRFGASKVLSRPNLPQLTPGGSVGLIGTLSVTSGNPALDPIRATSYDLSAEWYFAKGALLSAGFFYKDIETYIQTFGEVRPFNTGSLPNSILVGTNVQPTDLFIFTQPLNTEGGPLQGIELSYQQPLTFLPERFGLPQWTGNFGLIANGTFVSSEIEYVLSNPNPAQPPPTTTADLIGLSKTAYNGTLYYEDEKFSARISAAYRDRYFSQVPGGNTGNDVNGYNEALTVDAAASYNLTPKIKLTFEGLNLTDAKNYQFQDTRRNSVLVYSHTGRQYNFGIQYRF